MKKSRSETVPVNSEIKNSEINIQRKSFYLMYYIEKMFSTQYLKEAHPGKFQTSTPTLRIFR